MRRLFGSALLRFLWQPAADTERMRITGHCRRLFYTILLTAGVFEQGAPPARADDVGPRGYPPGWNAHDEPAGPILYDFRSLFWGLQAVLAGICQLWGRRAVSADPQMVR